MDRCRQPTDAPFEQTPSSGAGHVEFRHSDEPLVWLDDSVSLYRQLAKPEREHRPATIARMVSE